MGARIDALAQVGADLRSLAATPGPRPGRIRRQGVGWDGVRMASGAIDWDHNPDIADGAWLGDSSTAGIGRQMCAEDPEAARIIWEHIAPIITSDWEMEPSDEDDPVSLAVADMCERMILASTWIAPDGQQCPGWSRRLYDHLLMLRDGLRPAEFWFAHDPEFEIYRYTKPVDEETGIESRSYRPSDVAQIGAFRPIIHPRLPHTIDEWDVDAGDLVGIVQTPPENSTDGGGSGSSPPIPASSLMLFTFAQEGNNWAGQSILRPCWAYWQLRRQIMTYLGIGFSRWAVGTPRVKEAVQGVLTPQDWADLKTMVREHGVGANSYLMQIYGSDIDVLEAEMKTGDVLDKVFDRLGRSMHRAAGTEHVMSGEGYGAKSHIESKTATFNRNIQHAAHLIGEVYGERLLHELLWANGIDAKYCPRLRMGTIVSSVATEDATAYATAKGAGLITPQIEDQERFRSQHGWPQMSAATISTLIEGDDEPEPEDEEEEPEPDPEEEDDEPGPEPEPDEEVDDDDEEEDDDPGRGSGGTDGPPPPSSAQATGPRHVHGRAFSQSLPDWNSRAEAYAARLGPVHGVAERYFAAATSRLSREDAIVRASADIADLVRDAIADIAAALDGSTDIGAAKTAPIPQLDEIRDVVRRHLERIQEMGAATGLAEIRAQADDPMYPSRLAAAFAALESSAIRTVDEAIAMGRTVGKGGAKGRQTNALDELDLDAQMDGVVDRIVDGIEADIRAAAGEAVQAQAARGGASAGATADTITQRVGPQQIRAKVQPASQGVYASGKAAEGRSSGAGWGVYTLTPELGGPDGNGHTPCQACQQLAESGDNPFELGSDAELRFATPNPECYGGARCWCEVILLSRPEGASAVQSRSPVEVALSLVAPGGGAPVIHITGPQLAGKTFVTRRLIDLYDGDLAVWDVWDWYVDNGVIDDQGQVNWKARSEAAPRLREDLLDWLARNRHATGIVVESSGINRTINEILADVDHLRITLEPAPEDEAEIRARQRGIDPARSRGVNGAIKRQDTTPPISQAAAMHLILQVLPPLPDDDQESTP